MLTIVTAKPNYRKKTFTVRVKEGNKKSKFRTTKLVDEDFLDCLDLHPLDWIIWFEIIDNWYQIK